MPESATPAYTLTARVLHWVTAALVLTMIPIGVAMANADFGAWQDTLYDLHRSIGAVLLPLVLGRLLWRLTHPAPPLPADIPAIQQFAAHATHWALYGLLIAASDRRMGRDVGLSRADPGVLAVRVAADLARGQSLLRHDVHGAPGHRHRDCAFALRPHRRGAVSPLHPQGWRVDAHGERLNDGGTGNRPHDRRSHVPGGRHRVARKLDPVPADGIDGAARPAPAAQHRHRAGRSVHRPHRRALGRGLRSLAAAADCDWTVARARLGGGYDVAFGRRHDDAVCAILAARSPARCRRAIC